MSLIFQYIKRHPEGEDNSCFVIMPFNEKRNIVYRSAILPAIEATGLRSIRADEQLSFTPILFDIYDAILSARVVLADISEPNVNVYYELGIAHALKRNVILICEKNVKLPFDIGGIRYISYRWGAGEDTPLKNSIEHALSSILAEPNKDFTEAKIALEKAFAIWVRSSTIAPGEITISQEQYVEATLSWDDIGVTEKQAAFLAHAAAYYGKLMRVVVERVKTNPYAIASLVDEVATGVTIRVPWRASAMLEQMDEILVSEEIKKYNRHISNSFFPKAILDKITQQMLYDIISEDKLDRSDIGKLKQALKQIEVEFGSSYTKVAQESPNDFTNTLRRFGESVEMKPGAFGFSVDLKKLARLMRR